MAATDGLTLGELSVARNALAELVIRKRRGRELVPVRYDSLLRRLDALLTCGGAATGSSPRPVVSQSEWIDTNEAAAQIGCTARRVRQIAPQLGGHRVGTRWVFPRDAVKEHADGRTGPTTARR